MTRWFAGVLLLLMCGTALSQNVPQDAPRGRTPRQVSGKKSSSGITVTSAEHGFTLELPGEQLQALSNERLIWSVDSLKIELLVARRSFLLPDSASDEETLRDYRSSLGAEDSEEFVLATGSPGVVWNSSSRVTGAAVVSGTIVVLTATEITPATQKSARDYIKRAMSTLRPMEAACE